MGIGYRVFFFNPDGTVRRISQAMFDDIWVRREVGRLSELAGQSLRCAMAFIECENRKPVSITHTEYFVLHFDKKGQLDAERQRESVSLGKEMSEHGPLADESKGVRRAERYLAMTRYDQEFRWEPTPVIEEAIRKAIFGARIYHL
ncbi:MAG: hypothetical protein ACYTGV_00515 [Planctomycetota bacterium]|jgi:hypothetical protein